jgi:hypothetical protein
MSSNSLARVPGAQAISVPDTWTVVAISLVAAALTDVLHEAVGHGGACVLIGAHPLLASTVHFECSVDSRILSAGGTLVNLVAGLACLIVGRRVRAPHWRYFLWLLMTFNLLDAAGYFLYSGIGNIGDWAYVIHGYQPTWAWRVGLTLLGAATYWWFVLIALRELQPLLSIDQEQRLRLARRLLFTSYFTNGVLLTLAGLFNPIGMFLVAISAMAASFGGCSGLLWMGSLLRGSNIPPPSQDGRPITRSSAWIVTAAIIAIMFIAILGRGVRLSG